MSFTFSTFDELLPKSISKFKLTAPMEASLVINAFWKVLDTIFTDVHQHPKDLIYNVTFLRGNLHVETINAAVSNELYLQTEAIKSTINRDLGQESVNKINIRSV